MLNESETVTVYFSPQAWINDHAVAADPAGPTPFEAPVADATDAAGNWLPDHDYASDVLREHDKAPAWIRNWSGPFVVEVEHEPMHEKETAMSFNSGTGM